ncbi:MAG: glycine zipper family protein [Solirubrobacteraceae bacterium]|nr:glycine zipper family protein [Solirubrobacteraceae bacterium]
MAAESARRSVGTYDEYRDAQRAVDLLSDQGFPVERVAIVGRGLRFEEQVLGRETVGSAAARGAGSGAAIGGLFGLFLWAISANEVAAGWIILYGLLFGAIFGALLGAIFQAASGGQRDFRSASRMTADHYDVMVDVDVADEAERLLDGGAPAAAS